MQSKVNAPAVEASRDQIRNGAIVPACSIVSANISATCTELVRVKENSFGLGYGAILLQAANDLDPVWESQRTGC